MGKTVKIVKDEVQIRNEGKQESNETRCAPQSDLLSVPDWLTSHIPPGMAQRGKRKYCEQRHEKHAALMKLKHDRRYKAHWEQKPGFVAYSYRHEYKGDNEKQEQVRFPYPTAVNDKIG